MLAAPMAQPHPGVAGVAASEPRSTTPIPELATHLPRHPTRRVGRCELPGRVANYTVYVSG